jgi:predicted nucleic acid-binding protein
MSGTASLLDTNIAIGLLDGRQAALDRLAMLGAAVATSAVSQITRIELLGWHAISARHEAKVLQLLTSLQVLPLDAAVEQAAIDLRRRTRLKLPDAIIGATALVHGLRLVTLDARLAAALTTTSP